MEKTINDIEELLKARLDIIDQAEKTDPEEYEKMYIKGKKMVYDGFLELIRAYKTGNELKDDIEKRKSFLRFYSNLYRSRWDKYNFDINNGLIQLYGDDLYNKIRGRRDACSDLHHELKRMLEVIPDA